MRNILDKLHLHNRAAVVAHATRRLRLDPAEGLNLRNLRTTQPVGQPAALLGGSPARTVGVLGYPDHVRRMQLNDERGAMLDLMLRAYLLAMSSSLRSYERGVHLCAAHFARLTSEPNEGVMLDELRAWARELGELQSQETRLFVQQLDELIRQFSSASDDAGGEVWKRWKVKP